jgi:MinD superfamily P-loop ATPase
VDAIAFPQNICGKWYISETRFGPLAHAKLGIAEENSGRLVTLVRNKAKGIAEERQLDLVIIDGPPGIGCPVIAATTGASAVLIVTEPTLSGLHDLDRVGHLAAFFKIPTLVCVNKCDLNPDMTDQIEDYARRQKMYLMGRIPYDRTFTHAMVEGKSIVEFSDGNTAEAIKELWSHVEDFLKSPNKTP